MIRISLCILRSTPFYSSPRPVLNWAFVPRSGCPVSDWKPPFLGKRPSSQIPSPKWASEPRPMRGQFPGKQSPPTPEGLLCKSNGRRSLVCRRPPFLLGAAEPQSSLANMACAASLPSLPSSPLGSWRESRGPGGGRLGGDLGQGAQRGRRNGGWAKMPPEATDPFPTDWGRSGERPGLPSSARLPRLGEGCPRGARGLRHLPRPGEGAWQRLCVARSSAPAPGRRAQLPCLPAGRDRLEGGGRRVKGRARAGLTPSQGKGFFPAALARPGRRGGGAGRRPGSGALAEGKGLAAPETDFGGPAIV